MSHMITWNVQIAHYVRPVCVTRANGRVCDTQYSRRVCLTRVIETYMSESTLYETSCVSKTCKHDMRVSHMKTIRVCITHHLRRVRVTYVR